MPKIVPQDFLVVGTVSDDPFAIDVAHYMGQDIEVSDLISLKTFANTEFCPRFICNEQQLHSPGEQLQGRSVVIVSSCCGSYSRNALAMRTFLTARAAKDNGAAHVILAEPDLFYSAQDRGPRPQHGRTSYTRTPEDFKKFDGQPFTAKLYATLLKASGVDTVVTVHNHSLSVRRLFTDTFNGRFHNMCPSSLFTHYFMHYGMGKIDGASGIILCAPDGGAVPFVLEVQKHFAEACSRLLLKPQVDLLLMDKARSGERRISLEPSANSPCSLADIRGRDVIVFDDMVRTGSTVVGCCRMLKDAGARRVVFVVTHFHSSDEGKENLNHPAIDEIITTNSLPAILNRDMQGRLRRKMAVLKVESWIADFIKRRIFAGDQSPARSLYTVDMSTKNPRWKP